MYCSIKGNWGTIVTAPTPGFGGVILPFPLQIPATGQGQLKVFLKEDFSIASGTAKHFSRVRVVNILTVALCLVSRGYPANLPETPFLFYRFRQFCAEGRRKSVQDQIIKMFATKPL
jgi:hypothetical protein